MSGIKIAAGLALGLGVTRAARGAIYDAVDDFSGTSNPSGTWGYLWAPSVGASLAPLGAAGSLNGDARELVYSNGQGFPTSSVVTRNFGPGDVNYATVILPTNLLRMDPQNTAVVVRWTAPADDTYTVSGLFQIIDDAPHAHEVQVLRDYGTAAAVLDDVLVTPFYGEQVPFGFTSAFTAGETLEFVVNSIGDASYLSTGLSATIASVPEPRVGLVLVAPVGLMARRRR